MPRLINPYSGDDNPIAGAISGLADSMFGDVAKKELIRQKALGLIRENENIPLVADALQRGDFTAATGYGVRAGMKGADAASWHLGRTANQPGVAITDPAISKAYVGAGHSATGSPWGVGVAEGNKRAIAQMTTDRTIASDERKFNNTFEKVLEPGPDGTPTAVLRPRSYLATRALGDNPPAAFDSSVAAADRAVAADERKFNNTFETVYGENNRPELVPRSQAAGRSPVLELGKERGAILRQDVPGLTADQRAAAGEYEPKDRPPYDYTTLNAEQGTTFGSSGVDAQTGAKLPPGVRLKKLEGNDPGTTGNSTADNRLHASRFATQNTLATIDDMQKQLSQPNAATALGLVGRAAVVYSNTRAQLDAGMKALGGETFEQAFIKPENAKAVQDTINRVLGDHTLAGRLQRAGINRSILESQIVDLAYTVAKAQNPSGQIGKADVEKAGRMIGAHLQDPRLMSETLTDVRRRIERSQDMYETTLKSVYPQAKTLPAPGSTAPIQPNRVPTIKLRADGTEILE